MTVHPANLLVIFGATGDLAQRMLLPSLYGLQRDGLLPQRLRILCTGRSLLSDEEFAHTVTEAIERRVAAAERDPAHAAALLARIRYQPAALDDDASLAALCNTICQMRDGEIVYHLSTAPRFYAQICAALGAANLAGAGTRVMLEKPIGHDLDSSIEINDGVGRVFAEERIFRVDHYLGKEGVQNLLALRFGNALFEPLWNARHIAQVQITVAETVGVEGRGDYYDHSGAMRDMLQNHLLQLLCLTAMEPPSQFDPSAVRNEKLKVLRSLRPIEASDAASHSVAGQYTAGAIEGVAVPGYRDELGRTSNTETFVALRAHVDNWRWSGVPFYLRTGKRLPSRCTEIWLQFRAVPHSIFGSEARIEPNALLIQLQPEERISLTLMSKTPGLDRSGLKFSQVALDLDLHDAFDEVRKRTAYERLYLDALEGNGTLFVRRDETEAAWQWVDGIFNAWKEAGMTPKNYPAGTWGPASSVALIERHGHSWRERSGVRRPAGALDALAAVDEWHPERRQAGAFQMTRHRSLEACVMTWTLHTHPDPESLAAAVAARIASDLDAALAMRGRALLALAGGRTSPPVFRQLATQPRDWSGVTILPSDERWVAANHAGRNLRQMHEAFAAAHGIHWLALVPDLPAGPACADFALRALAAHPEDFDVAMLGMGVDGHFASLFPGAPTLAAGLALPVGAASGGEGSARDASGDSDKSSRAEPAPTEGTIAPAIAIVPHPMPAAGPHPRVSLTLARLLRSRTLLLVITGDDKRAVLERAQAEGASSALPVAALLCAAHPSAEIHWSP